MVPDEGEPVGAHADGSPIRWRMVRVTDLRDAEDVLDWLESTAHSGKLVDLENGSYLVRWQ